MNRSTRQSTFRLPLARLGRGVAALAGVVLLMLAPGRAHAAGCGLTYPSSQGIYSVPLPSTIVNDPSIPVGGLLATLGPTNISAPVTYNCNGQGNGWGLATPSGGSLSTGTNIFPTSVAGVGYRVKMNGAYLTAYPYAQSRDNQAQYTESSQVTIELVKTGPIADGSSLQGPLAGLEAGATNNVVYATINLTGSLNFPAPACQVSTTNVTVTLPAVTAQVFSGVGSVADTTPFHIGLVCSSGQVVRITLDTATPVTGRPGVIAPSSGGAGGLGVQLLDSSGTTPVQFGSPQTIGATPNGPLSVNYYARYYQTGNTVTAGQLGATATFTLSYQ